jgi:hypothetical protein
MKPVILLLMCSGALWAQSPQAVIREITGTVELKSGETGDWIPAKPGDILAASVIISTGFRSTAILAVGNSTLTVRPVTRLNLEELISQNAVETISVGLRTGRIRAEVTPPAGVQRISRFEPPSLPPRYGERLLRLIHRISGLSKAR